MNYRNGRRPRGAAALVTLFATGFSIFCSILLLKFLLYEYGSLTNNIFLLVSMSCARFYLISTNKPTRTHEKVCLVLFVLYDKDLLEFFNVFLLLGVECIRQQMDGSPNSKELVTAAIGLVFLLMGWLSVGRVLVIYHFTMILIIAFGLILVLITIVFQCVFLKSTIPYTNNIWDEVN